MLNIFNSPDNFFNYLVKTNGIDPSWITNKRCDSVPISNKYFLTLFNSSNANFKSFCDYIEDDTRTLEFPFGKENDVDYSLMIEPEQMCMINCENLTMNEISSRLNELYKIVKESDGQIILALDIGYLIENYVSSKQRGIPNHLIEFLLWKLNCEINEICLLDVDGIISNPHNLLCAQFEMCIKNFNNLETKYNFEKNILVYKDTSDTPETNVYWNLFYPHMKITEHIGKILSPYDMESSNKNKDNNEDNDEDNNEFVIPNEDFHIAVIDGKECFAYKLKISEHIEENLLNIKDNPIVIIDPLDRLNVFL